MIYCVIGNGNPKGLEKYLELKQRFVEKYPEVAHFHYDVETVSVSALTQCALEDSLFGGAYLTLCQRVGEHLEVAAALPALIPQLLSSPNHFLMYEEELDPKLVTQIEKGGGKVYSSIKQHPVSYNAFDFSRAVAMRDRRRAWVELMRARRKGVADEELIKPALVWQIKVMLIAVQTSASESGLKSSVYSSAERAARNYSFEELAELSFRVSSLHPRVVSGEVEMDIELESLVLNL